MGPGFPCYSPVAESLQGAGILGLGEAGIRLQMLAGHSPVPNLVFGLGVKLWAAEMSWQRDAETVVRPGTASLNAASQKEEEGTGVRLQRSLFSVWR